jgi:hypothetical protein
MELTETTRIDAGVVIVRSVKMPFRSISCPMSLSGEKFPVSFAQTDSPLRMMVFLSVVERCTQPEKADGAGAGGGAAWPKHGMAMEQMQRAMTRAAMGWFIRFSPVTIVGRKTRSLFRRFYGVTSMLLFQMSAEVVRLGFKIPEAD